MLVVFPTIFVSDTKIIYGYNFVAPLRNYRTCSAESAKPKIGNREKHQGKHGKYPKKLGKQ